MDNSQYNRACTIRKTIDELSGICMLITEDVPLYVSSASSDRYEITYNMRQEIAKLCVEESLKLEEEFEKL